MVFKDSKRPTQAGFSQGSLIWIVVIFCFGMLVKSEFFPGISKGMSAEQVLANFGQPVAKTAIQRPG